MACAKFSQSHDGRRYWIWRGEGQTEDLLNHFRFNCSPFSHAYYFSSSINPTFRLFYSGKWILICSSSNIVNFNNAHSLCFYMRSPNQTGVIKFFMYVIRLCWDWEMVAIWFLLTRCVEFKRSRITFSFLTKILLLAIEFCLYNIVFSYYSIQVGLGEGNIAFLFLFLFCMILL